MVEQLDLSTGRLPDLGRAGNTLVVFTSDNGGQISNEAHFGSAEHGRPGGRKKMIVA